MRRALALALLFAAAPAAVAHAGPPRTGFEQRDGASWTTFDEEQVFLRDVVAGSARVAVDEIGRTKAGRPLQLVRLGSPGPRDAAQTRQVPTVLLTCSQHGNEPAGREACLTLVRDLAFSAEPAVTDLLQRTALLVIPSANPDGRASNTRENGDGTDVNRDHLGLTSLEARAAAGVVRDFQPDVAVDLHEYGPSLPVLYDDSVLWLWPRNLNTDKDVHDLAITLGREYLVPAAQADGFTTDEYGQYEVADNDVTQTAGDADEGIMRNAMGLRHVLGILVETRVDGDVRTGPSELADTAALQRRRVASHRSVLNGLQRFMAERGAEVAQVTATAIARKAAEGANRSAPVYFGGADNAEPAAGQVVSPSPCGYRLTDAQFAQARSALDLHGIVTQGPFVGLAQPAEPLIPLLLDARGARHLVEAEAAADCPPPAVPAAPSPAPTAPGPSCTAPRTVALGVPRRSGRVLSTHATLGGRALRVRRGVIAVPLRTRAGRTVRVVVRQRVRRDGRVLVVRTVRTFRVCKA